MSGFSFGNAFSNLGVNVSKQFNQISQYAKEQMGNAEDITELPIEYQELEYKVQRIRILYENLSKVGKNFSLPHYDYQPPVKDTMFEFASTVGDQATSLANSSAKAVGVQSSIASKPKKELPPTIYHAFSTAALISAESLGTDDSTGNSLKTFADVQEQLGSYQLIYSQTALHQFYLPLKAELEGPLSQAGSARRRVHRVRLAYDACRSALKSARPDSVETARAQMERAEDDFVAAVDEAMGILKSVAENRLVVDALLALQEAQRTFFVNALQILDNSNPNPNNNNNINSNNTHNNDYDDYE